MTQSILSDFDQYLLAEGTHYHSYEKLGAQVQPGGVHFAVWAPHALGVAVAGDFNGWDPHRHPLTRTGWSGIWEGFVSGAEPGARYLYAIAPEGGGELLWKADPHAFASDPPPGHASHIIDLTGFDWHDSHWIARRPAMNASRAPIAIYEVHLPSWRHPAVPETGLADLVGALADHVAAMGYTHVQILPDPTPSRSGACDARASGYFAPPAGLGRPHDLMTLVDTLHRRDLGVLLGWSSSQVPAGVHGLQRFDGSPIFEAPDLHLEPAPEAPPGVFQFGHTSVRNFLISSALFWIDRYHFDGLSLGGLDTILHRNHGGPAHDGSPNLEGRGENREGIAFLKQLTAAVHEGHPGTLLIAEESVDSARLTDSPGVGGLGFDLAWDLNWFRDTVTEYLSRPPEERPPAHRQWIRPSNDVESTRLVLPLSHDTVDRAGGSLLSRMPGDDWRKRASLRILLGAAYTLPGKTLVFMGSDIGQWQPWDPDRFLDWSLRDEPRHAGIARWVRDLNTTYRGEPALHELDGEPEGFQRIEPPDPLREVIAYLRRAEHRGREVLIVLNLTPQPFTNYRVGVPGGGVWDEILNSDALLYGGSGQGNLGGVEASPLPAHGLPHSLNLTLPPLALIAFRRRR